MSAFRSLGSGSIGALLFLLAAASIRRYITQHDPKIEMSFSTPYGADLDYFTGGRFRLFSLNPLIVYIDSFILPDEAFHLINLA
jgi:hypothetical protein